MSVALGARRAPFVPAIAAAIAVGIAGGLATDPGPWYRALRQSALQPPGALFGPAWAILLTLAGAAAALAWEGARSGAERRRVVLLFAVNAVLNVGWSVLFFQLRRPDLALLELGFLWLSILVLVVALRPFSGRASLLLLPYLAWVGFAGFLNLEVIRLN